MERRPIRPVFPPDWLTLWSKRFSEPLDDAETFRSKDGWLNEIGNRADNISEVQGQYMGLLKISPTGWQKITSVITLFADAEIDNLDMTKLLKELLKCKVRIKTIKISGKWCEIDSLSDVHVYENAIINASNSENKWSHDWR